MDNVVKTFTQKIHYGNTVFYENYIHIKDFINIYLKDMQIEVLKQEPNQLNQGKSQVLEELIKELNSTNETLSGEDKKDNDS